MKLKHLIENLSVADHVTDRDITGITIDSRKVEPGHLFMALHGTQTDGHAFIGKAIEAGATAVLCDAPEQELVDTHPEIAWLRVPDVAVGAGMIATRFYGNPTDRLKLVGVTGTNGKTTIATLLYRLFRAMGHKVGLLSTVCNYIDGEPVMATHTTPDVVTLNRLLGKMADAGCEYAFMEVSSHACSQQRIAGLCFAGGIFTNLTRDHLDYHLTVQNYLNAKKMFFDALPADAFMLTNLDDRNGLVMGQNTRARVVTYSLRGIADYKARILEEYPDGMMLEMMGMEAGVKLVGRFNASNLLAVVAAAVLLGKPADEVVRVASMLEPVAGRFETLRSAEGVTAVIDYAHTPDALANVLATINEVLPAGGHILTVVGAGGNRDKGKRPLMALEAVKGSDRVILTSDNPRDEEPDDIIRDMLGGLDAQGRQKVVAIACRREAIRTACLMARPGDMILVAGKGHEDYQEIKGERHHFDDKEEVLKMFAGGC